VLEQREDARERAIVLMCVSSFYLILPFWFIVKQAILLMSITLDSFPEITSIKQ